MLTEANINNSDRINNYAFYNCKSLNKAVLGRNVKDLGNDIFGNCNNLSVISLSKELNTQKLVSLLPSKSTLFAYEDTNAKTYCSIYNINYESLDSKECELGYHNYIVSTTKSTCEIDGKEIYTCSKCGNTYTNIIPATGHNIVIDKEVKETCIENGLTEGSHCSICNKVFIKQEAIPASGHTIVVDEGVVATCTEAGLTEGSHCSICASVLVEQTVIPATGHAWDYGTITKSPTCTEIGETLHICQNNSSHTKTGKLLALGHKYSSEITLPTCTEEGFTTYTCARCGNSYVGDYVPAISHTYIFTITKQASESLYSTI